MNYRDLPRTIKIITTKPLNEWPLPTMFGEPSGIEPQYQTHYKRTIMAAKVILDGKYTASDATEKEWRIVHDPSKATPSGLTFEFEAGRTATGEVIWTGRSTLNTMLSPELAAFEALVKESGLLPRPPVKAVKREALKFDPKNPVKIVKQVLHQCWGTDPYAPKDLQGDAWGLRDLPPDDWKALQTHMEEHKLIEESGEPGYYKMTRKGSDVLNGSDYL